ncbi:MAG: hypothetical protein ACOH2R_08625 [Pseudomonas sp.]
MTTTISGTSGVSQCAPGSVSQDDLQPGVAGNGPVFRAHNTTTQSVTSGVATKVTLDTEDYDTANCFAGSRFTPNVAGYYRVSGVIRVSAATLSQAYVTINKNGTQAVIGGTGATSAVLAGPHVIVTDVFYMNGTTDYLELFGLLTGTTLLFDYVNTSANCSFCGELVRAA